VQQINVLLRLSVCIISEQFVYRKRTISYKCAC